MKALERLYQSGMTRASVATAIDADPQLIGLYERCQRFPQLRNYSRIVNLADSRGVLLLARDFIERAGCGNDGNAERVPQHPRSNRTTRKKAA